jgi:hypothetical protein
MLLLFTNCSSKGKIVAKVGDFELYQNELEILMDHYGYDLNSKSETKDFVNQWCENQLYKLEIQSNNPEKWQLIQLKKDHFGAELAKYYFEETSFNLQLDSIVTEEEINNYYTKNKDEFILQDYIVKALYLKIPKSLDFKKEKVHTSYLLKNDKDLAEINSYAKLYAENFYFDDSSWIYFSELTKDIPIRKMNIDNIVLNRSKTYFSDDDYTYFLNIIDYKLKDEAPPIAFLTNDIKESILRGRLQQLKEKKGPQLTKDLKKKYEIIINL